MFKKLNLNKYETSIIKLLGDKLEFSMGLFLVVLFYLPSLTNRSMFGGDGKRIISSIDFIDRSKELYPMWNSLKNGGLPVFSDPERFFWLGYLFDTGDTYLFLKLNILSFIIVLLMAIAVFKFCQLIGLTRTVSACVMFVVCSSYPVAGGYVVGRLYALCGFTSAILAVILYIKYIRFGGRLRFIGVALILGFCISTMGYYSLVTPMAFLFVFGLQTYFIKEVDGWCAVKHCIRDFTLFAVLSFLLYACFIIPPLYYNLNLIKGEASIYLLRSGIELFRYILPISFDALVSRGSHFHLLISLLILPGVILFVLQFKHCKFQYFPAVCLYLLLMLFFSLVNTPILEPLFSIYKSTPFLGHMRNPVFFDRSIILCLGVFASLGVYQAFIATSIKSAIWSLCIVLGVFLLVDISSAAITAYRYGDVFLDEVFTLEEPWRLPLELLTLASVLYVLSKTSLNRYARYRALFLLVVFSLVLGQGYSSRIYKEKFRFSDKALLQISKKNILKQDDGYYRVYCTEQFFCPPWNTNALGFSGFSNYFLNSHREAVSDILGGEEVEGSRPHWVELPKCRDLDKSKAYLEMANIKYLICEVGDIPPDKWIKSGRYGKQVIYKNKNWVSGIRFFSQWEIEKESLMDRALAWNAGTVLIADKVGLPIKAHNHVNEKENINIHLQYFSNDKIGLSVENSVDGVVFIPEYFSPGWRVKVNGAPKEILRVFGYYRGVFLKAGTNNVEFTYRPNFVVWSCIVSIFSWVVLFLFLFLEMAKVVIRRRNVQSY